MESQREIDALQNEVRRIRDSIHSINTVLTTISVNLGMIQTKVAAMENAEGKASSEFGNWKNWLLAALFAAVIFLLLKGGLPRL